MSMYNPVSERYLSTRSVSRFEVIFNSLQAPTKLVPLSERMCLTGPLIEMKRLRALIKLDVSKDSVTSMCTALMHIQVNMTAQRLLLALPPLVCRVMTAQGPNTSRPTFVKGGSVLSRSAGRLAIF